MKNLLTILISFLLINTFNAQLWLVDPLEPIYPDSNKLANYSTHWEADFPMGTIAEAHIIIKLPKSKEFKIFVSLNKKSIYNTISELIDVPVEQNTGLDSRTEIFTDQINPHVIRRAPFRIYEVIKPLENNKVITKNPYTALRLEIPSILISDPGKYVAEIYIEGNEIIANSTFQFTIHPVELTCLKESKFFYTNWFNLIQVEKYHNVERWSSQWYNVLDKYAALMSHGRQNSITIPNELFQYINGKFILDEDKLLKFINVFRNYGFQYFESPHLMYRGDEDDWSDPELKVVLTKKRYYTENGKEDIEKLIKLIKEFTQKNNLENNWLQHIADEPTPVNAKCYKDIAKQVKNIYPEIKIMEATNARDDVAGAVDIWCPIINDFQENEEFFRGREKLGEKVLVYTCLIPGGKWLNRTLDMEKLRQVYFGWGAAYYKTSGYLHWGLNQYYADPYKQSVIKHPSPIAGPTNFLPAGDTHIIYPDQNGPLSSIRFESHRIGCEDYELLQIIELKNPDLHNNLITELFRSYTDYELDIRKYREIKKQLLYELSKYK